MKSFGVAFLVWFFLGAIGGHRVYIQEKPSVLLWYWLLTCVTLGIFPIIDLFKLKGMVERQEEKDFIKQQMRK